MEDLSQDLREEQDRVSVLRESIARPRHRTIEINGRKVSDHWLMNTDS